MNVQGNKGEIIIYHNQDGNIKIDVRLEDETVWLKQVCIPTQERGNENDTEFH